jgi:hypothetical protein
MVQIRTASDAYARLAAELEVPATRYEEAERAYRAIGEWLDAEDSPLHGYCPRIYVQGSFALGTAIKPIGDGEYDVDAVCLLEAPPPNITQQLLKKYVGDRLSAHGKYEEMLEPRSGGRRCWTVKYAESARFHLDILPAIPDENAAGQALVPEDWAKHAIKITDRELWEDPSADWPRSNPKGYLAWFKARQRVRLDEERTRMAKSANVEIVPDDRLRTPLHRVIQLLKRHRDEKYIDDPDRPISIIITTLAARCYENEADLAVALANLVPKMKAAIEYRAGVPWVANPVHPEENFADKWAETPRKEALFLEWLDSVEKDHMAVLRALTRSDGEEIRKSLNEAFGQRVVTAALASSDLVAPVAVPGRSPRRELLAATHRQALRWPLDVSCKVELSCTATRDGFRRGALRSDGPVPPQTSLDFQATTNARAPFEVFWQVVNTGPQAKGLGKLRGGFERGELGHHETAQYIGTHWIQCFLVRDGRCIGKSAEFVVDIRL